MTEPFIEATDLSKSFDDKIVLDKVSLTVRPGEIVGLLGKNGAGKTTLLELILGFTPATGGRIEVFGHESYRLPGHCKRRIGFVPQMDELVDQLTASDQLRLIRSFYPNWDDALIERLVGAWEIDPGQRIRSMSVGQRQKLSILTALGHRPDLLILDEPVASLDPLARRHFLEQIVEVAADGNRAVVFSSHIVSDIERLANTIWILKDSHLHWRGDFDDLRDSIVRLHVRSPKRLPLDLRIPNALSIEISEQYATAIVSNWTEEMGSEVAELTGVRPDIESLTLEDIFLELHR